MRIDHITSSGYSQERGEFTVKYADGTNAYIVGQVAAGDVNFGIGTATPTTNLEVVGAISASGNITGNTGSFQYINLPQGAAIKSIAGGNVEIVSEDGASLQITDSFIFDNNGATFAVNAQGDVSDIRSITASGDISGSTEITAVSGSFGMMQLEAPNGTIYKFTVDNNGRLSITGSAV